MRHSLVRYLNTPKIYKFGISDIRHVFPEYHLSPRQLSFFSRDINGNILLEDVSSLHSLKIPTKILKEDGKPLFDLSKGYEKFEGYKLDKTKPKIHDLLTAIKDLEIQQNAILNTDFICSRGVLVDIATFFGNPQSMEIEICCIGGQIVMSSGNYRDAVFTDPKILKSNFSGSKLESVLTNPSADPENKTAFKSLVDLKIGDNNLVFSAEVDACKTSHEPELSNYVEIKGMLATNKSFKYKRKVYNAALQCLLAGTDELLIGIRDRDYMLKSLFKVKVNGLIDTWNEPKDRYNLSRGLAFLDYILTRMRTLIDLDESKAWKLTAEPASKALLLEEIEDLEKLKWLRKRTIGEDFESHRKLLKL